MNPNDVSYTPAPLPELPVDTEGLTTTEKTILVLLNIFISPIIVGPISYIMWRGTSPEKARGAGRIALIIFGLQILMFIYLMWALSNQ
jgi:hypothetical protein